jgi:hypothetical protein
LITWASDGAANRKIRQILPNSVNNPFFMIVSSFACILPIYL